MSYFLNHIINLSLGDNLYNFFISLINNIQQMHSEEEADINPAFLCPISNQQFVDPVIAEDGQTYQRSFIIKWLQKNPISPKTRQSMKIQNLKPNIVIKQMISEYNRCKAQLNDIKNKNKSFINQFEHEVKQISNNRQQNKNEMIFDTNVNVQAFTCPLTRQIFEDPVFCFDGYTYERKAILKWFETSNKSPVLDTELQNKNLIPNYATKSMIDLLKEQKQNQWGKQKEQNKRFIQIFAPKINQMITKKIQQAQKQAASNALEGGVKNKVCIQYDIEESRKKKTIYDHFLPQKRIIPSFVVDGDPYETKNLMDWEGSIFGETSIKRGPKIEKNQSPMQKLSMQKQKLLAKKIKLYTFKQGQSLKALFQVPQLCKCYIERQEIIQQIQQNIKKSMKIVLCGLSGTGKSQLVISWIHSHKFQKVIWLNCLNPKIIIMQIQKYLQIFSQQKIKDNQEEEKIISMFQNILNKDTLIILDDAEKESILKLKLNYKETKVLITSKQRKWKYPIIEVGGFSKQKVQAYFVKFCEQNSQLYNQGLEKIKLLSQGFAGCLPLHLSHSIYFKSPNQATNPNLNKLQSLKQSFKQCQNKSTHSQIILTIDKIRKQNKMTDEILDIIGYVSTPEQMNLKFIFKYFSFFQPERVITKAQKKDIKKLLRTLNDHCLISARQPIDQQNYFINQQTKYAIKIIHDDAGTLGYNTNNIDQIQFETNYQSTFAWMNPGYYKNENQEKNQKFQLKQLRYLQHCCYARNQSPRNIAQNFAMIENFRNYYEDKQYFKLNIFVNSWSCKITRMYYGEIHIETAYAILCLIAAFLRLDAFTFVQFGFKQLFKILEVLNLPRDHPIKLILLHLMKIKSHKKGTINLLYPDHIKMKDYKKYNQIQQKVANFQKAVSNQMYVDHLFEIYRPQKVIDILLEIKIWLQYYRKVEDIYLAYAYHNVGVAQSRTNDKENAEFHFEQAISIYERINEVNNKRAAETWRQLSLCYKYLGKNIQAANAESKIKEILKISPLLLSDLIKQDGKADKQTYN